MKITNVNISRHIGPFGWCLVQIDTDDGVSGIGEAPLRTTVQPEELGRVRAALAGQSPLNVEPLLLSLQRQANPAIINGIEMALLDLSGKQMNAPLWAILGGKYRNRIRMYSDSHAGIDWDPIGFANRVREVQETGQFLEVYRPEAFARHAREVIQHGFTAIKFDIDFPTPTRYDMVDRSLSPAELRGIVDAVAAVREAIGPDVDLAIDCHARYNVADALRIAYEVEPFKLMWLEDPVPPRNVETMAKVTSKARVPICTGESLQGRHGFQELVTKQAADIIQPDTPRSGSIREIKRIAELAEMYHISIAPHNMTSPVATLAAVHLCAAVPNFLALEFHCGGMPWWNDLAIRPKPILDRGYILVPDAPGLGLELDFDAVREHVNGPLWLE
ncbi:MAG TPA: mandelate racemase/muconate lactonizing enzyme family protein [Chloroflexota bacterium]|nr:mandelate racemase/muconate lactonizing enzyme family protein [Chloroflexota bacterium]